MYHEKVLKGVKARRNHPLAAVLLMLVVAAPCAAQDFSTFVVSNDGTPLATDVYQSFGDGPWPVVLIRTPYDKDGLWALGEAIAVLGFACVIQDTRGRFGSGGEDTVFRDDAIDGRATVEWVAQQDWCDGNLGTFGGSAFGITEYLLAPNAGPALRSMMSVAATPDLYHHAFVQGGAIREALAVNWLDDQGSLHMYDEVRRHRLHDQWWDPVEVLQSSDRVNAAGLHVGGWFDIFAQGTLDAFSAFQYQGGSGARGRQYLIMGPWTHGSLGDNEVGEVRFPANARVDALEYILPWFNHTLRGWPNDVEDWPAVLVYVMGALNEQNAPGNEWIELANWPPPARDLHLYLADGGDLRSTVPDDGEQEFSVDPDDPIPTLGGNNLFPDLEVDGRAMGDGPHDQRPIEDRVDVLTFTSRRLQRPVTVMGRVSATLWLRSDTSDLDLAVRLTDVYPDGRSMLVLDGVQRARMRCGDNRECLLVPGRPTEIAVDLWSTAMVFNGGHRIRVDVSGSNAPRFEVNPNDGGDLNADWQGVLAHPQLLFGPDYPSRVRLPVPARRVRRSSGRLAPTLEYTGRMSTGDPSAKMRWFTVKGVMQSLGGMGTLERWWQQPRNRPIRSPRVKH